MLIQEVLTDVPAAEVIQRLDSRDHQILMAEAPLPDDPGTVVPVSYKVSHELRSGETDPKLIDLVGQEGVDAGRETALAVAELVEGLL